MRINQFAKCAIVGRAIELLIWSCGQSALEIADSKILKWKPVPVSHAAIASPQERAGRLYFDSVFGAPPGTAPLRLRNSLVPSGKMKFLPTALFEASFA
jgi:hypothetical protein